MYTYEWGEQCNIESHFSKASWNTIIFLWSPIQKNSVKVSKASEESSTRRSSKGHLVWVHVLFWQCLNLRELDKDDKPHPSDTSGRTNADKNLCSFNIECSDTRKYVLYVHSEPVCSGVLGAWCSSSCLPRQKLYKQRLSHM